MTSAGVVQPNWAITASWTGSKDECVAVREVPELTAHYEWNYLYKNEDSKKGLMNVFAYNSSSNSWDSQPDVEIDASA